MSNQPKTYDLADVEVTARIKLTVAFNRPVKTADVKDMRFDSDFIADIIDTENIEIIKVGSVVPIYPDPAEPAGDSE